MSERGTFSLSIPNSASCSGSHGDAAILPHAGDQQHVGAVAIQLEPFRDVLAQHRRSERPEGLAELDLEIEQGLGFGRARIGEDGTPAERSRPEFHSALKPAQGGAADQFAGAGGEQGLIPEDLKAGAGGVQAAFDFGLGELGAEIRALHGIHGAGDDARLGGEGMIRGQRRAESASRIPRGRLYPDVPERSVAQDAAVGDAVQGDAAGQTEVGNAGFGGQRAGDAEDDFLEDALHGSGQVHVARGERLLRPARGTAEEFVELPVGHGEAGAIVEEIHD